MGDNNTEMTSKDLLESLGPIRGIGNLVKKGLKYEWEREKKRKKANELVEAGWDLNKAEQALVNGAIDYEVYKCIKAALEALTIPSKPFRFFILVPLMPSSHQYPTYSQFGFAGINRS